MAVTSQEIIEIQVMFEQAMSAFDKVGNSINAFTSGVEAAGKKVEKSMTFTDKLSNSFTNLGSTFGTIGAKMTAFSNKLLVLGASWTVAISNPLKKLGQDSFNMFLTVERSWVSMAKVTGDSIDSLKDSYGEFAIVISETYGIAQSDAIDSMNEFMKAGITSEEQLKKLSKIAAETAILFDTDLTTATDITKQSMQQWGWEIDEVKTGMSIINEIADATATSELELAQAFTVASPAARVFGIEMNELGGYIAAMAARGYHGAEAGTALKTVLQYMSQDAEALSDALSALGVEMTEAELNALNGSEKMDLLADAYGNFREDVGATEKDMRDWSLEVDRADGPITNYNTRMNEVGNVLGDLVRKRQFPKLIGLVSEMSEGLDEGGMPASEYAKALASVNITSQELETIWGGKLQVYLDSAPGKWDVFTKKVGNAKVEIGGLVSDALTPFVEKATELLDKFKEISPEQKEMLVKFAGLAVVLGPVIVLVSTLVKSFGTLFTIVGPIFSAIGGIIGAIGAGPFALIALGIASMVSWIKKLSDAVQTHLLDKLDGDTFKGIKEAFDSFIGGFKEGFDLLDETGAEQSWMDMIGDALENLAEWINKIDFEKLSDDMKKIGKVIGVIAKVIAILFKLIGFLLMIPVWLAIINVKFYDWAYGLFKTFKEWTDKITMTAINWINRMIAKFNAFITAVAMLFTGWKVSVITTFEEWKLAVITTFTSFRDSVFEVVGGFVTGVLEKVTEFATMLWTKFNDTFGPLITLVQSAWGLISAIFEFAFLLILATGKFVWETLASVVVTAAEKMRTLLEPIITWIQEHVVTKFIEMKDKVVEIFTVFKDWVTEKFTELKDDSTSKVTEMTDAVVEIYTRLKEQAINKFNEMKNAVVSQLDILKAWVMVRAWAIYNTFLAPVVALVAKVADKFNEMKNRVVGKLNELKIQITNRARSLFQPIIDKVNQAYTWGRDVIQNFVNGMSSKFGAWAAKIGEFSQYLKDYIGFSVPEKGPLSDADTWMPDMVDLMVGTLDSNAPRLGVAAANAASIMKDAMAADGMLDTAGTASISTQLLTDGAMRDFDSKIAAPISAAAPNQNIVQVHKHFEVKPGVMIASDAEQREFVRHIQKLEGVEDTRTTTEE